jgi:hypothetical protein
MPTNYTNEREFGPTGYMYNGFHGFYIWGRFGTCPYRIIPFGKIIVVGADSKSALNH